MSKVETPLLFPSNCDEDGGLPSPLLLLLAISSAVGVILLVLGSPENLERGDRKFMREPTMPKDVPMITPANTSEKL